MKKKIVIFVVLLSMVGLYGCSASQIEKAPVEVPNTQDDIVEITPTEPPAADKTFTSKISLEGTDETITCKTNHSRYAYQVDYDIERFKVSNKDGADIYMAENSNPDLYPYVYMSVSESKMPNTINPEQTKIGNYDAKYAIVTEGKKWNSKVTEYYEVTVGYMTYLIELHYYLEASEGYGARLRAMLNTFRVGE
jgi:hypothetical protein